MRIGQKIKDENFGTLTHGGGIISLAPSTVNVGGVQIDTDALSRQISLDVPTMSANTLYMIYVVMLTGAPVIRISTNINSIGPTGFASWKLVGAFYTDTSALFNAFISKSATTPSTFRVLSGSGTYTTPTYTRMLRITLVGGGGGGSGAGNSVSPGTSGGSGSASTFGGILSAGGGSGGLVTQSGGSGTANTISAPAIQIFNSFGGAGGSASQTGPNVGDQTVSVSGGAGGASFFGSGTIGGYGANAGGVGGGGNGAIGGGGGGGSKTYADSSSRSGSGGGGGSCLEALIISPLTSYAYTVGSGGTPGNAGTNGGAGDAGRTGTIVIEEFKPNLEQIKDL